MERFTQLPPAQRDVLAINTDIVRNSGMLSRYYDALSIANESMVSRSPESVNPVSDSRHDTAFVFFGAETDPPAGRPIGHLSLFLYQARVDSRVSLPTRENLVQLGSVELAYSGSGDRTLNNFTPDDFSLGIERLRLQRQAKLHDTLRTRTALGLRVVGLWPVRDTLESLTGKQSKRSK